MGFIEFNVIMIIMAGLAAVAAYFISSSSHWRQRAEVAERELSTINHTAFDAMANRAGSKPAFSEQKPLPEATAGFRTGSDLRSESHKKREAETLQKGDKVEGNGKVLTDLDIAHLAGGESK